MTQKKLLFPIILLMFAGTGRAQKFFTAQNDIFANRVFIENKGQYKLSGTTSAEILFAYENTKERIYFTSKGLIHEFAKRTVVTEEQEEKMERGKKVKLKPDEFYHVYMTWPGSSPEMRLEPEDKVKHYYTCGGPDQNASGYKKLVYRNVYPFTDIEYVFPSDKHHGIKYNIILHPGADVSKIRIAYSGDIKDISLSGKDVVITTPLESITEHAPISYSGNEKIHSAFFLEGSTIAFNIGPHANGDVVIDPWVTTLNVPFPVDNTGYEVDHDNVGNCFVYGLYNKVAKYDQAGNLLWVFLGVVPSINWGPDPTHTGSFGCNRVTGKCYLGEARVLWAGARIIRLDQAGNYDNFVTPQFPNAFVEIWNFGYNCMTSQMIVFGGYTGRSSVINEVAATINAVTTVPGDFQDNAIDDAGNVFGTYSGNGLMKFNPAITSAVWTSNSFAPGPYGSMKYQFINPGQYTQCFNNLAVNNFFLFTYSGNSINVMSKTNGALITSTPVPGYTQLQQAGIAVDNCNNIYIGGNGSILCYNYNSNNNTFAQLPPIPLNVATPNQFVYDLKLSKTNILYACGSGFAGAYSAIYSNTCSPGVNGNLVVNCSGLNTGSAVATITTAIPNATFNYVWTTGNNTVSATMNTPATSNSITLPTNGVYTLMVQANAPCGPVFMNTFAVNCCASVSVTPSFTQTSCTNSVNAVSIFVASGNTVNPVINWSPAPVTVSGNSLSASGLSVGINTVSIDYGSGCVTTTTFNMLPPPPPLTFSINNLSNSNVINCYYPLINLQAITGYTYGSVSYTWSSINFSATSTTVSVGQSGSVTLNGVDPSTGCTFQQTIALTMNTVVPTNTVNPPSQSVNCASNTPVSFTGAVTTPTVNFQHDWYSPFNPLPGGSPIATSGNSITLLSGNVPPGVYTLVTTDLTNGCKAYKTVTVTSLDAWPAFSINCPTNYSIGCSPLNQTTISIVNPISTQTPPAACSFTFLPPGFGGVISPTAILGNNTSTTTQIPGTWTLIVQDNSNFCRTQIPVSIIQNTVPPNVSANILTQTLTCYNPTLLATGTSSTPNTVIEWQIPSTPPLLSTPTVVIGIPSNGPNTSTTSLNYASYTVVATNTVNACQSTSVVVINQNFKPPVSSPTISIATPTAIYCTAATHPAVLTTGSSTTTSGGGPLAFVSNPCWAGPSPQTPTCGPSSYSCYVAGVYTLTVMDNFNGCKSSGTVNVLDKTQPPVIANPAANATLDCGASSANLLMAITGQSTGLMYWFYEYPVGAAFSPTAAPVANINLFLAGTPSSSVNVSTSGYYQYVVSNTLTGCQAYGTYSVTDGGLNADFTADPMQGFAPMTVNLTNNSSSSLGTSSINSIWNFGNGNTQNSGNANTTYTAPGIYTVTLFVQKGNCLDTVSKIIRVELPSKLEVPNIFTPNGDGKNDVFFLNVANIKDVHAIFYDRWGDRVYETSSSTGNILWDGKNLHGKECSDGVYFYVLTAEGGDAKKYEQKGNVSLFR